MTFKSHVFTKIQDSSYYNVEPWTKSWEWMWLRCRSQCQGGFRRLGQWSLLPSEDSRSILREFTLRWNWGSLDWGRRECQQGSQRRLGEVVGQIRRRLSLATVTDHPLFNLLLRCLLPIPVADWGRLRQHCRAGGEWELWLWDVQVRTLAIFRNQGGVPTLPDCKTTQKVCDIAAMLYNNFYCIFNSTFSRLLLQTNCTL